MTLRFPRTTTVQADYGATLVNMGNPEIVPYDEAFAQMNIVRRWSMRSPTAQLILQKIDSTPRYINVVCFRGPNGDTVFSSDDPPGRNEGTIFWNIDWRFMTKQGPDGNDRAPLHHFIATLHELGHAVQWIENPIFFDGNMTHGKAGESAIKAAAEKFWRAKALRANPQATYGQQNTFAKAYLMHGQNRMTRPAWSVRIEMDNLNRHEWPICDEAGYPRRSGYTDLVITAQSPFAV